MTWGVFFQPAAADGADNRRPGCAPDGPAFFPSLSRPQSYASPPSPRNPFLMGKRGSGCVSTAYRRGARLPLFTRRGNGDRARSLLYIHDKAALIEKPHLEELVLPILDVLLRILPPSPPSRSCVGDVLFEVILARTSPLTIGRAVNL